MSERVLIVTGASRGIGAATALLAASRGWAICVNYRTGEAEAAEVVRRIEGEGGSAIAIKADTDIEADVEAMFASVDERFGRLDGLVNNAGILGEPMMVDATEDVALRRMLSVNIGGYFLCLREAARRMKGRGGAIVNVGSRLSEIGGGGGFIVYAATKGAVESMTVGAARELAPDKVRVNCVSPGVIATAIHESTGIPDRAAKLTPQVPAGRPGTAEEVAETIVWLLSDQASYVTGASVNVSGGR